MPEPPTARSTDAERLVDLDIENLAEQDRPTEVPDDDRVVPEDLNAYVAPDKEASACPPGKGGGLDSRGRSITDRAGG